MKNSFDSKKEQPEFVHFSCFGFNSLWEHYRTPCLPEASKFIYLSSVDFFRLKPRNTNFSQ
jgi:hypothetical protein